MLTISLIVAVFINSVHGQINGDFWWLNDKLNNFRNAQPVEPKIEVLSEFENDESAKIIFRDNDVLTNKTPSNRRNKQRLYDRTDNKIVWPTNDIYEHKEKLVMKTVDKNKMNDELVFDFPQKDKYVTVSTEKVPQSTKKTENELSGEIPMNSDGKSPSATDKETQNICTYIENKECYQIKGIIYNDWNNKKPNFQGIVCCILPIQPIPKTFDPSPISFPDTTYYRKPRQKRSEDDKILNQRNFLLQHKFSQHKKNNFAPSPKIVTPVEDEDDVDPYWNIKNSKFQTQYSSKIVTPSYNYDSEDYGDYASELPKPGLIGLYSDHAKSPSSWSFTSNTGFTYGGAPEPADDYEDDDVEDDFGYSTIDPRKAVKKQKRKPVKFTTISDEVTLDAESHTINFHSNPDFHVMQGFKLLNLFRNTSRVHTKNSKRTTTRRIDDRKEFLGTIPAENADVGDEFFEEDQLFGGCGEAVEIRAKDKDKQLVDAASGSHPWTALVVLTKRRQNVLCYATLVHPRAAITVADCVHGTSPRDITVIAGAWDLNDRSRLQNRIADIHVHPRYRSGDDDNNLAVLYWMRPLKLGANTQPACLGEPHVGDECRFFGWGSLDQGIQPRSRWQRASIRMCDSQNKKQAKSSETFCASVSRGTVTSLGGSLICSIDGHNSAVGTVVSMDGGYVLMPIREFAMKANEILNGD